MTPITFPQAHKTFGPPEGMDESQVHRIAAFLGTVSGGSCDGMDAVVVAWQPTAEDIEALKQGQPIFLTTFGGLPPHCVTTHFPDQLFET